MTLTPSVLLIIAMFAASAFSLRPPIDAAPGDILMDFLRGFYEGFNIQEDVTSLRDCLKNKENLWESIKTSARSVSDINTFVDHFKDSMASLFVTLGGLVTELRPCIRGSTFIVTIVDTVIGLGPAKLFTRAAKAAVVKNSALLVNVHTMYDAVRENDAHKLGKSMAEFMSTLLLSEYVCMK